MLFFLVFRVRANISEHFSFRALFYNNNCGKHSRSLLFHPELFWSRDSKKGQDTPAHFRAGVLPRPILDIHYLTGSKKAFSEYVNDIYKNWTAEPKAAWVIGKGFEGKAQQVTFNEFIEALVQAVEEGIKDRERM